jgi:hypothetical protein
VDLEKPFLYWAKTPQKKASHSSQSTGPKDIIQTHKNPRITTASHLYLSGYFELKKNLIPTQMP